LKGEGGCGFEKSSEENVFLSEKGSVKKRAEKAFLPVEVANEGRAIKRERGAICLIEGLLFGGGGSLSSVQEKFGTLPGP